MKLPVLTAADGAAWEERLVTAFERGPQPVEIVRRCVDIVDVLAVAASGQGRVALLDAGLRRLDADAVDRLHAATVVPVGVVPRGDTAAEDRMRALGVDHVLPDDADVTVAAGVIIEAARSPADPDATRAIPRVQRGYGDPSTSMAIPPGAGEPVVADEPHRRGSVVAVWGPTGAPGRTTVATHLADEIARLGSDALLVDADVYGGTVAAVLGLLDESPGLAAACRRASAERLDAAALASLCWQLGPQFRVLTGIPIASRWPELRPTAVGAVLGSARTLADYTVVDCGFCLETDEELSFYRYRLVAHRHGEAVTGNRGHRGATGRAAACGRVCADKPRPRRHHARRRSTGRGLPQADRLGRLAARSALAVGGERHERYGRAATEV